MRRFRLRSTLRGGTATPLTSSSTRCCGKDAAAAAALNLTPCVESSSHHLVYDFHPCAPSPGVICTFADKIKELVKSRVMATRFAVACSWKYWRKGPLKDARKTLRGEKVEVWKPCFTFEQGVICTFAENTEEPEKSRVMATWFAVAFCWKFLREGPPEDARKTHSGKNVDVWKPCLTSGIFSKTSRRKQFSTLDPLVSNHHCSSPRVRLEQTKVRYWKHGGYYGIKAKERLIKGQQY